MYFSYFEKGFASLARIGTPPLGTGVVFLFVILATYTDLKSMKIPNRLNLAFAIGNLALFVLYPLSRGEYGVAGESLLGGTAGFCFLLIPAAIVGFKMAGDIKFMGALGLAIGIKGIVPYLLLSCGLNLTTNLFLIAVKKSNFKKTIPFAPFFLAALLFATYYQ